MNNSNLRKALEASRFYYAQMYDAMRPAHEKICLEQKQILIGLYSEVAEMETRLRTMEEEFGYKYNPSAHKFNPYHDDLGRFTSGPGGGSDNNRDGSTGVMVPGSGTVMDDSGKLYPVDSSLPKPDGIPDDWPSAPTQSREGTPNGGMRYFDPNNPKNDVRVMPAKPDSEFPSQQQPYVRWNLGGQALDANGNPVSVQSPEAHIPLDEFEFIPEIFP